MQDSDLERELAEAKEALALAIAIGERLLAERNELAARLGVDPLEGRASVRVP